MEESYPALPALESVKVSNHDHELWIVSALIVPLQVVSTLSLGYIGFHYLQYFDKSTTIICLIFPAFALFLAARTLFAYASFEADSDGLNMRGIICRKHLKWEEIDSVWITDSGTSDSTCLHIKSGRHTYRLHNDDVGATLLTTSIHQHMIAFGRADKIVLGNLAKRLWTPILDAVPNDISFGKPATSANIAFAWTGLALFVAVMSLGIGYFLLADYWLLRGVGVWGLVTFYYILKMLWTDTVLNARSIKIDSKGLKGQYIFGIVNVDWNDVSRTSWLNKKLNIYANDPKRCVSIKPVTGDTASEFLISAIIRELRTAKTPQAVIVPKTPRDT